MQPEIQRYIENQMMQFPLQPGYYIVLFKEEKESAFSKRHPHDNEVFFILPDHDAFSFKYFDVSHMRMTNELKSSEQKQWFDLIAKEHQADEWLIFKMASRFSPHSHYRIDNQ